MTQLVFCNRPYFDHGAIKEISVVLDSLGIKKPLILDASGFQSIIAAIISRLKGIPLVISDQGGLTTHPFLETRGIIKRKCK